MWYIILILFTHFMADFVFQNRDIANRKHNSTAAVVIHSLIYITCLFVVIGFPFAYLGFNFAAFILINGLFHFVVDWVTSRMAYYYHRRISGEKKFWVTIGLDQFIHAAALIISAYYLLDFKI